MLRSPISAARFCQVRVHDWYFSSQVCLIFHQKNTLESDDFSGDKNSGKFVQKKVVGFFSDRTEIWLIKKNETCLEVYNTFIVLIRVYSKKSRSGYWFEKPADQNISRFVKNGFRILRGVGVFGGCRALISTKPDCEHAILEKRDSKKCKYFESDIRKRVNILDAKNVGGGGGLGRRKKVGGGGKVGRGSATGPPHQLM